MALKGIFSYQGLDNTSDLNALNAKIVDRGIFDGGTLILSGSSLQVTVPPFVAVGYDGMVVTNDANIAVPILANATSYLVCLAKYNGSSAPTIEVKTITSTEWLTSINKDYFITFAKLVVPVGVTAILPAYMDYSMSDYADKGGKTGWRSPVANFSALPTQGNRANDIRLAGVSPYYWDQTIRAWLPVFGMAPTDSQTKTIPFVWVTSEPLLAYYVPFQPPYFINAPSATAAPNSGPLGAESNVGSFALLFITQTGLVVAAAPTNPALLMVISRNIVVVYP